MDGNVKIPGVGAVDKKKLMIGGIIGLGVAGVFWLRRRGTLSGATGTAAAAGTSGTAGSTGDPNLDPATGYDYGTAADQAALAGGGSGGFGDPNLDPVTGYDYGTIADQQALSSLYGGTQPHVTPPAQTETQWISQAASDLAQLGGVSRSAASEALTEWIAGQTITAQQAQYVREALALDGNPPGGSPPIHQAHRTPEPKPKVKVPDVVARPYPRAAAILAAHHLKARRHPGQRAVNVVVAQDPHAGAEVTRGTTVTLSGEATG